MTAVIDRSITFILNIEAVIIGYGDLIYILLRMLILFTLSISKLIIYIIYIIYIYI